jgi:endonuclease/exonuclease/phosphatase family metal-dependent hydrolase
VESFSPKPTLAAVEYNSEMMETLPSFRAMSFNLRFDCLEDGQNAWSFRKDIVASTIRFHKADICGVQEALRSQVNDLVERLPEYSWIGVGRDDGRDGGEFCAIFYRKDRFRSVDSGTFWLSETPSKEGSKSWGSACRRITTWGRFQLLTPGFTTTPEVFFFNAHFDHHSVKARSESSLLLTGHIPIIVKDSHARFAPSGLVGHAAGVADSTSHLEPAVVVVGDFNDTESSDCYRHIVGLSDTMQERLSQSSAIALKDSRKMATHRHNDSVGTFTNWAPVSAELQQHILIDYILYHGNVEPEQYGIICELWQGRRASDHRPIITDFKLKC